MERSRMSLDWLAGYELRRGWRGPSPNIVVVVVNISSVSLSAATGLWVPLRATAKLMDGSLTRLESWSLQLKAPAKHHSAPKVPLRLQLPRLMAPLRLQLPRLMAPLSLQLPQLMLGTSNAHGGWPI